jgi:hypothetical protein
LTNINEKNDKFGIKICEDFYGREIQRYELFDVSERRAGVCGKINR